tara:strand:- start:4965 stop:5321 length:357 start_codon:yes stop_codon:yes gene_type:complete
MSDTSHGWGYLGGMVESTNGEAGSVQVRVDNSKMTGDSGFTYDTSTGIVTITGGLIVAGIPFGVGNMDTVKADVTQIYAENTKNVVFTEDDETVTVQVGATMKISEGATVKTKKYSEA